MYLERHEMEQGFQTPSGDAKVDEENRREAILHIKNGVDALGKIAEEHNIDFLSYVLRLAKLETELLLSPEDDDLGV